MTKSKTSLLVLMCVLAATFLCFIVVYRPHPGQSNEGAGQINEAGRKEVPQTAAAGYPAELQTADLKKAAKNGQGGVLVVESPEGLDPLTEKQKGAIELIMGNPVEAAEELFSMAPEESSSLLLKMFRNSKSSVNQRDAVIKTAMLLGHESLRELLYLGLDDAEARIRCSALRAWLATGLTDAALAHKVKDMLVNDNSQKVRQVAARYFYQRAEQAGAAAAELCKALDESQGWTAWRAASALAFAKVADPGIKEKMEQLYRTYHNSQESRQRALASAAVGYLAAAGQPGHEEALLKYLLDEDKNVRAGAVLGMPALKEDAEMMNCLAGMIETDRSKEVFYALSRTAGEMRNPVVKQACSNGLKSITREPRYAWLRLNAALAVAAFGDKRNGFSVIYEQMNQSHPRLNPVFNRLAHTELCRASKMNFPYNPFRRSPEQQQWQVYIDSLEN